MLPGLEQQQTRECRHEYLERDDNGHTRSIVTTDAQLEDLLEISFRYVLRTKLELQDLAAEI